MATILEQLQALAQQFSVLRLGAPEVQPGQPVVAKVVSPASDLSVTDLVPLPLVPPLDLPVSLPVGVDVAWRVQHEVNGNLADLSVDEFLVNDLNVDAGDVIDAAEVSFVFKPAVVELSTAVPPPTRTFLRASITLTAGGVTFPTAGRFELPELPVLVQPLGVPAMVALFRHRSFAPREGNQAGFVLLVVPDDSPLGALQQLSEVFDVLNTLDGVLRLASMQALFGFDASVLRRLRVFKNVLLDFPSLAIAAEDTIPNLNQLTLIQRSFVENDIEAANEVSSLIYLGPQGRRLECFNRVNLRKEQGQFNIAIGRQNVLDVTLVERLDSAEPVSDPPNLLDVVVTPNKPGIRTFDNELSSLRLARLFGGAIPSLPKKRLKQQMVPSLSASGE